MLTTKERRREANKFYKLRSYLNKTLEKYKFYYDSDDYQSIDDSMTKFKALSSLRLMCTKSQ